MDASDMKELRVILDNIDVLNDEWFDTFPTDEGQTCIHDSLEYEITKANKILAKRPRQCDVGTAEEQLRRWQKYCENFCSCVDCPLNKENELSFECLSADCFAHWAQTPYAAKEGAGK